MTKLIARFVLIGCGLTVMTVALAMVWLKAHEDELVFATARSRQHLLTTWPADAERVSIHEAGGTELAGLVFHADGGADAFWVLHLHGNADSAFSPWQIRHCEALRGSGFNVLEIDYRGFGATPGQPSETAMNEDAEAAYQALLQRGVAADRIILLGHSLGSGPAVLLAARHKAAALVLFGAFTSIPEAPLGCGPYLPRCVAVAIQFDSLARLGGVHLPVIIAHRRADTLIPYSHALRRFAAANEPKQLVSFDAPAHDGFGGHVDALYEHVDVLQAALADLVPAMAPARPL